MRNLTITRRKSFVGCAMKDQVYIRDETAQELTIEGVPCRKIGDIKNGETKTFQIGEGEQQIFLIADKLSKNYCNATTVIPEGTGDVALSGVHKFVFGSNPFRFDNAELTEEQIAKQKKNGRKGMVIMAAAVILGVLCGRMITAGLFSTPAASPETFTKGEFQITLTEEFAERGEPGFYASYHTKSAIVLAVREEKGAFADLDLNEYAELVLEANGKTGLTLNQGDGFVWFEYTDAPDGQEAYYMIVCCEGGDDFWIVNFITPSTNQDLYQDDFLAWAKTIEVD